MLFIKINKTCAHEKEGATNGLDLTLLVIPITLLAGIVLGRVIHGTVGMIVSAVAGALVYMLSLYVLSGSSALFTFDIFTQLLMITFGAIMATFGWFIGENYELLFRRKTVKKII